METSSLWTFVWYLRKSSYLGLLVGVIWSEIGLHLLCLRYRVPFYVDLKSMSRLQVLLGLGINGPLYIAVFSFVNGREQIEMAFPVLLFSKNR